MNEKIKILLVEDDPNLGALVKEFLEVKNYKVFLAQDGDEGLKNFIDSDFDVCILDIMLPKLDGFNLAREIRSVDKIIPIIFLTAKSQQEDKIEGFKIGGDDYLTKPFSMEELIYRINAILKRTNLAQEKKTKRIVEVGKFNYNFDNRLLISEKVQIKLTSKENQLLNLLVMKKGEVLSRSEALVKIWKSDSYFNSRSMDVYITKLRSHFKNDESVEILNIHGEGFKIIY